jgi:hypothetical protein
MAVPDWSSTPTTSAIMYGVRGYGQANSLQTATVGLAAIVNRGGTVWILGLKVEKPGTVISTLEGGKTELLGGFVMASGGPKSDPMFFIQDASASIVAGEVAFQGSPFRILVSETRAGVNRILERGSPGVDAIVSAHAGGSALPFYAGFDGPGAIPPPTLPGRTNRLGLPGGVPRSF